MADLLVRGSKFAVPFDHFTRQVSVSRQANIESALDAVRRCLEGGMKQVIVTDYDAHNDAERGQPHG